MRLSINWIFEHINLQDLSLKEIDIPELINKFSLTSVEIDNLKHIDLDLSEFTLGVVKSIDCSKNSAVLYSHELEKDITILLDKNIEKDLEENSIYLLNKDKRATLKDLGYDDTDKLFPAIYADNQELLGSWKKDFESEDYIIEISNIAITNRPDLWGHRGFAREFAAILDKKLVPEEDIFINKEINSSDNANYISNNFGIEIKSENKDQRSADYQFPCRRLAGLYFKSIENKKSLLKIATRLSRVGCKPFNMLVDFTNYIMFDLSQPMHAFDADTIKSKNIIARFAYDHEKLELLDKSEIQLNSNDYVITDSDNPIALAGIKGGYSTSVQATTKSIFLESANFNPFVIRNSSLSHRIRTESSSRFEKNLDPNQNVKAIFRFLKLLDLYNINYEADKYILSLGELFGKKIIEVSYNFILTKLGISKMDLPEDKIQNILSKLDFDVKLKEDNDQISFIVTAPTYRAIKDISIKEDILKEIIRFLRYDFIKPVLPSKTTGEFDIWPVVRTRAIKQQVAYGLAMSEVQTYAFFDQEFLRQIDYQPENYLEIKNPQSQNYKILITNLIPNLLKCVYNNINKAQNLSFFELNRVWFKEYDTSKSNSDINNFIPVELVELSGIFYDSKMEYDFYAYKAKLNTLFSFLGIESSIKWKKFDAQDIKYCNKLYDCLQTAELFYKGRSIGMFGKVNQLILNKIVATGSAYIFELDANFLINIKKDRKFKYIPKYPESSFDISLLINQNIEVATIIDEIKSISDKIKNIDLIDMFYKKEWEQEKSLAFRVVVQDECKTLVKEEISDIYLKVINSLEKLGAKIR